MTRALPAVVALAAVLTSHSHARLGWALAWIPVLLGSGVLAVLRASPTPFLVGAIAFTLLASVSARRASYRPEGDEPWYLVQADSLVHDFDLQTPMEEAPPARPGSLASRCVRPGRWSALAGGGASPTGRRRRYF